MFSILKRLSGMEPVPKIPSYLYRYVFYACIIFLTSTLLGYYAAASNQKEILSTFKEISNQLTKINFGGPVTLFLIIFLNNTFKIFTAMILGVFFGITPIVLLFANGYIFGIVSFFTLQHIGVNTLLLGILPHGIIELPATLLGMGYGLWLGNASYRRIFFHEPIDKLKIKEGLRTATRVYFSYLIPLFFLAAFMEVFVTDSLLHF